MLAGDSAGQKAPWALQEGPDQMSKRRIVYEGKAKILYEGPEPGTLIQYFKDDTTAFDAQKKAVLDGKGVLNNRISEFIPCCGGSEERRTAPLDRVGQQLQRCPAHASLRLRRNALTGAPSQLPCGLLH